MSTLSPAIPNDPEVMLARITVQREIVEEVPEAVEFAEEVAEAAEAGAEAQPAETADSTEAETKEE